MPKCQCREAVRTGRCPECGESVRNGSRSLGWGVFFGAVALSNAFAAGYPGGLAPDSMSAGMMVYMALLSAWCLRSARSASPSPKPAPQRDSSITAEPQFAARPCRWRHRWRYVWHEGGTRRRRYCKKCGAQNRSIQVGEEGATWHKIANVRSDPPDCLKPDPPEAKGNGWRWLCRCGSYSSGLTECPNCDGPAPSVLEVPDCLKPDLPGEWTRHEHKTPAKGEPIHMLAVSPGGEMTFWRAARYAGDATYVADDGGVFSGIHYQVRWRPATPDDKSGDWIDGVKAT